MRQEGQPALHHGDGWHLHLRRGRMTQDSTAEQQERGQG
jgi:hypothetical protein